LFVKENLEKDRYSGGQRRPFWQPPWGYREGLSISLGLLITGFALEAATGGTGLKSPSFPYNLVILIALLNVILFLHAFFRDKPVIRWLSSVPASLSAIILLTFLVLLLGLTPQPSIETHVIQKHLGLSHVVRSYPFFLAMLFFFLTLGLVTLRRGFPVKKKSIGFLLNHAGLWITLAAAFGGSGDMQRLTVTLQEGKDYSNNAVNAEGEGIPLSIAFKLLDFSIEEYPPKIFLIQTSSLEIVKQKQVSYLESTQGKKHTFGDWEVQVLAFLPSALQQDTGFIQSTIMGAPPAALVEAKSKGTATTLTGWISSGSFMYPPVFMRVDEKYSLAMAAPEARKYSSDIEFITREGKTGRFLLEVNKPEKINGWKIYQVSYQAKTGKWSPESTIELVRDPWLPVVYTGIFLLMAGALYLFWIGKDRKKSPGDSDKKEVIMQQMEQS